MVKHPVLRLLILLHRWFGVVFCLLFAMWFASGIVMHFVQFPALSESKRVAGLLPIDLMRVVHSPAEAVAASKIGDVMRIRLVERSDGPVYVVSGPSAVKALRADDLGDGAVRSARLAGVLATNGDTNAATNDATNDLRNVAAPVAAEIFSDQWTVAQQYDQYRPLYRVALEDRPGTEVYVSATTGEVVLKTTRWERWWNYAGSVAHWIYPTALRSHPGLWASLLWWLSLLAMIGVGLGAVIGTSQLELTGRRPVSPYWGWHAWHHWLGLCCMVFVLTWIFSGWLSMDDGQIFSTGRPTTMQGRAIAGDPDWQNLPRDQLRRVFHGAKEVEWFAFDGRIYRRDRLNVAQQQMFVSEAGSRGETSARAFLRTDEVDAAVGRLAQTCVDTFVVKASDDYPAASTMPDAPLYRVKCGADWFDIDGSNGTLIAQLDQSRRVYRWLYAGLHRLDFLFLTARPALRTGMIVVLCGCGFLFSLTGIVIAARRLLSYLR
jgi:hypothetical protein